MNAPDSTLSRTNPIPQRRRASRRNAGSAALVALTAILPLVVAGGTMLAVVVRNRTKLEVDLVKRAASDAASAGAQDALARLQTDAAYVGAYDVTIGANQTHVTVTPWENDLVDNDGLNGVDDPAEAGFVAIRSEAWVNVVTDGNGNRIDVPSRVFRGTAEVLLKKLDVVLPIAQSVYVDDENADVDFDDAPFVMSGEDTNLDGSPGPLPAIPGIGVAGSPDPIKLELAGESMASVVGSGGSPSVVTVSACDFVPVMDHLSKAATIHFNGTDDDATGALGDLATMTPAIAHARGNLRLHDGVTGCGMLLVDGDLEVADGFDYAGYVLVRGNVTFKGDCPKTLHGALMTTASVTGVGLTSGATVTLLYSSESLATLTTKFADSYVLVAWVQK